jgi:hypothetical protein
MFVGEEHQQRQERMVLRIGYIFNLNIFSITIFIVSAYYFAAHPVIFYRMFVGEEHQQRQEIYLLSCTIKEMKFRTY